MKKSFKIVNLIVVLTLIAVIVAMPTVANAASFYNYGSSK